MTSDGRPSRAEENRARRWKQDVIFLLVDRVKFFIRYDVERCRLVILGTAIDPAQIAKGWLGADSDDGGLG